MDVIHLLAYCLYRGKKISRALASQIGPCLLYALLAMLGIMTNEGHLVVGTYSTSSISWHRNAATVFLGPDCCDYH